MNFTLALFICILHKNLGIFVVHINLRLLIKLTLIMILSDRQLRLLGMVELY